MVPGLADRPRWGGRPGRRDVPACRALLEYLRRHPEALSSGVAAPLSLIRLAHALAAAGNEGMVLPGCAGCGKVTADLRSWPGPGQPARAAIRMPPPAVRGLRQPRRGRRPRPGRAGLQPLHLRDPARHEECARCGRTRRVVWRDADGRPCCKACYPRPRRPCAGCGQTREVTATTAAGPVCARCYVQPPRPCGRCGRVRPIAVRARDGAPDLCASCHRGPAGECSQCGQHRILKGRRDGQPICERAIPRPRTRAGSAGSWHRSPPGGRPARSACAATRGCGPAQCPAPAAGSPGY